MNNPSELELARGIMIGSVQHRQATKRTGVGWGSRLVQIAAAIGLLALGQLAGPVPCIQGEMVNSPSLDNLPKGRVSVVTHETIIIDGVRYRLAHHAVVKWDLGGLSSFEDIRPGDLVHFVVKDFEIVLVVIVQPG